MGKCLYDPACDAEYVIGGRRHKHRYRSLAGFSLFEPVTCGGVPVGEVGRLDRAAGGDAEVWVSHPGEVGMRRYLASQLDTTETELDQAEEVCGRDRGPLGD